MARQDAFSGDGRAEPVPGLSSLAELFDESPMPAVLSRLSDNRVLAINKRTSELFGMPQGVAVGMQVRDYYVDPGQRDRLAEEIRRAGRVDNWRFQLRRPSGEVFWALASARLVNVAGEAAIFTVFTDISAQVATESAILATDRRLAAQCAALAELTARAADSSTPVDARIASILVATASTLDVERVSLWRMSATRASLSCQDLYLRGANRHEAGQVLWRANTPTYFESLERERVIAADNAHTDPRTSAFAPDYLATHGIGAMLDVPLQQNGLTVGVLCLEHVGGPRTWSADEQQFAISAANVIVAALADNERRRALARLAESETRARQLVDTAHDAFVGINSRGDVVAWNAQAERTFGWTAEEAIGCPLVEMIVPPQFREAHLAGMKHFHATGEAPVVNRRLEIQALHRSGREFPIEITITKPIQEEDGYFFGAFLRDISDRRERDAQLRRAKESAEAATRAKSEFLANMSHELRTPLNGVLGYAQLLQRDRTLSASQREALEAIAKGGSHLLDLINDVLDLSKIEAGRVDIETNSTHVSQLVVDLEHLVGESARRKGLSLAIDIAADVPKRVVLDGRHVRQVLLNLLSNAIKFTPAGEVRLSVSRSIDGDRLRFEVSDTGIGIAPDELPLVFEAFTQTPAGAAAGGTGLGLTICQHLLGMMGSALQVESTPGVGSRFHFEIACEAVDGPGGDEDDAPHARMADAKLAPGQELLALVTDDSTVNRRILARLLESAGAHVITAAGGHEAITLARKHRPDVVFMDVKMPDLDGLEATRRLLADPATAFIPVIAVTASAFGATRAAAMEAGCVDYLPKPVRADVLFSTLRDRLGILFVTQSAPAASEESEGRAASLRQPERVAARLRDGAALGAISDLEALARELSAGTSGEVALGRRIAQLASQFDFEGLSALAGSLGSERT